MKKKLLSVLLVGILLLGLTGCGKKSIALNNTIKHKDWEVKLVNVEFSDYRGTSMTECFITSNETYTENNSNYSCRQEKASSDKTYLLFELQMEYKGNKKKSLNFEKELELDYNNGYIVTPDTAYVNIGNKWNNWIYVAGEAINTKKLEVDPLESTTYILRGAFEISDKIETETNKSLKLNLPFNLEYTIR